MEKSFEMLSSMSPKVKGRQKTINKAITVLATKKHFRRSSVYERFPPPLVGNDHLQIINRCTDSDSVISSSDKVAVLTNKIQDIIIIDSSEDEMPQPKTNKSNFVKEGVRKSTGIIDSTDRINQWLENVDIISQKKDFTQFSEVSTIFNDEGENPNLINGGIAIHSTFHDDSTKRFDEFFKKHSNCTPKDNKDAVTSKDFDESFIVRKSLTSRIQSAKRDSRNNKKSFEIHNENGPESIIKDNSDISFKFNLGESVDIKDNSKNNKKSFEIPKENGSESINKDNSYISYKFNLEESVNIKEVQGSENIIKEDSKNNKNSFEIPKENGSESIIKDSSDNSYKFNLEESMTRKNIKSSELFPIKIKKCLKENKIKETNSKASNSKLTDHSDFATPNKFTRLKAENDNLGVSSEDLDNLMSSLYGQEWSTKKDILTPKIDYAQNNQYEDKIPTTIERIKMPKLKATVPAKNLNKLNLQKLQKNDLKSPWTNRLKKLCDSDTSSESSEISASCDEKHVNARLEFADVEKEESDKENSYWGESLEERIQTKINSIKVPTKKTKQSKKDVKTSTSKPRRNDIKKVQIQKSNSELINDYVDLEAEDDRAFDLEITKIIESKKKIKKKEDKYTFLESLNTNTPLSKIDISAKIYRTNYAQHKDDLAQKLFNLFNEKVFDGAIPKESEIIWNNRLRGTAGLCHCKKTTHRNKDVERKVKISLSSKVLDAPDRLRDTLIHEMCHAATWVVNQESNGHGPYWKSWALKAMRTFPELPPIKRCHSYVINTKYTYKCTQCSYSFGRHQKSLDINKKCCGICHGKFEVLINKISKDGETKSVPINPKQPSGFALFVKENYSKYKVPQKTHGDVMKILSEKFAEVKIKK